MTLKTSIIVNLQYSATHNWPDCDIKEVYFLKFPHRHVFHIRAEKLVNHDDRDIEIIMFKDSILKFLENKYHGDFKFMSCEMIAKKLCKEFNLSRCQVLEDGENGAEVSCV
jgi:hypothetical protein